MLETDMDNVQRTLGRIEGTNDQILEELKSMRAEFLEHKADDRAEFKNVEYRFHNMEERMTVQDTERSRGFRELNEKLGPLVGYTENFKGARWMLFTIVIAIAGLGAAVTWAVDLFSHWGGTKP